MTELQQYSLTIWSVVSSRSTLSDVYVTRRRHTTLIQIVFFFHFLLFVHRALALDVIFLFSSVLHTRLARSAPRVTYKFHPFSVNLDKDNNAFIPSRYFFTSLKSSVHYSFVYFALRFDASWIQMQLISSCNFTCTPLAPRTSRHCCCVVEQGRRISWWWGVENVQLFLVKYF